jgi:AraC-like DNA-binding protein
MTLLVRTSDVPPAERRDAWRSVVCDALGPLDLTSDPDVPLEGEIHGGRIGSVTIGHVRTSTPHGVHRTPRLIRRDDPELLRLVLPLDGSAVLSQGEHQARLGAGEFAVYDFSRPYALAYDSAVQLAVFSFPRASLSVRPVALDAVLARPLTGATSALAAPLLRRVTHDMEGYRPDSATRLATIVIDLVTAAVAENLDAWLPTETREHALFRHIQAFVEEHLSDLGLSPPVLAAAHHASVRTVHRLFAAHGTTTAAFIRERRLARCRRDLADPVLRNVPVSAIGARWGLPDASNFSRLFSAAFGMPPAEYRHAAVQPS